MREHGAPLNIDFIFYICVTPKYINETETEIEISKQNYYERIIEKSYSC